jgi:5-enolpyruvylshikimate-3-phosphate synthase
LGAAVVIIAKMISAISAEIVVEVSGIGHSRQKESGRIQLEELGSWQKVGRKGKMF